jgi:hypothetical protein
VVKWVRWVGVGAGWEGVPVAGGGSRGTVREFRADGLAAGCGVTTGTGLHICEAGDMSRILNPQGLS